MGGDFSIGCLCLEGWRGSVGSLVGPSTTIMQHVILVMASYSKLSYWHGWSTYQVAVFFRDVMVSIWYWILLQNLGVHIKMLYEDQIALADSTSCYE